jgi:hypothetical protein
MRCGVLQYQPELAEDVSIPVHSACGFQDDRNENTHYIPCSQCALSVCID